MARLGRQQSLLDGFLVVDKTAGMTSHDVVDVLRRRLGERRIGHAGTLDPDATGVLVVAVGRSTRLLRFVTGADKAYDAEIVLGEATSTLDASGEVVARFEMSGVTLDQVRAAAARLTGHLDQIPPMVSAIKVEGRRLYELARAGEEIDRATRPVEVTRFDVEATEDPLVYRAKVECSSGTYVRSLAADLGSALNGGAHLRALRRTRVGAFDLSDAIDASIATAEQLRQPVGLLGAMSRLVVDDAHLQLVGNGRVIDAGLLGAEGSGPWALLSSRGALLGVYERAMTNEVKPVLVHSAPTSPGGADAPPGDE